MQLQFLVCPQDLNIANNAAWLHAFTFYIVLPHIIVYALYPFDFLDFISKWNRVLVCLAHSAWHVICIFVSFQKLKQKSLC